MTQEEDEKVMKDDSKTKHVQSIGSNIYPLSQSTDTAALESNSTPTDCAPSRESAASSLNNKSMEPPNLALSQPPPGQPQQQEDRQQLYLSKPQTRTINNRPIPIVPITESMVLNRNADNAEDNFHRDDVNRHLPNPNDNDLEAHSSTPEVFVEAEVARDMDSVVNHAVSEALRERDRNIISAVHVETTPEENPEKLEDQDELEEEEEEENKMVKRPQLIYFGIGALITILIVVVLQQAGVFDIVLVTENQKTGTNDIVTSAPSASSATYLSLSSDRPLQLCQGNCNGDQDCDDGLMCMERIEGNLQDVPGCSGELDGLETINFCIVKTLPRIRETNRFPLGLCEGDCDTDLHCGQGMICLQRDEFEPVPHCAGGELDSSRTDYCIPQEPTASPTASPTRPALRPTPTRAPTNQPTRAPSRGPTRQPTSMPTIETTRDTFRFLGDDLLPFHPEALAWLKWNDTWLPPEEAENAWGLWRERYAVAVLYYSTNGPLWPDKGRWLSDVSVCQWNSGIGCNLDGQVDLLSINDWNHIKGSIPSELKALTMLSHLSFSSHELGGTFPVDITALTLLTSLDLRENEMSGVIPTEIGKLSKLTGLYLRQNNLVGMLPSQIGLLTDLQVMWFDSNLMLGTIPTEIGRITKLREISGFNNRLSGPLPSQLGLLTNLEIFHMFDNDLTGTIISEFGQMTNISWLSVYDNALVGNIPTEIGELTNMWFLHLSDNRLTGSVPNEFGNLYLEHLNLARNQLTGVFPVMTFDDRDSEPRCFIESNPFDDTSNVPNCLV